MGISMPWQFGFHGSGVDMGFRYCVGFWMSARLQKILTRTLSCAQTFAIHSLKFLHILHVRDYWVVFFFSKTYQQCLTGCPSLRRQTLPCQVMIGWPCFYPSSFELKLSLLRAPSLISILSLFRPPYESTLQRRLRWLSTLSTAADRSRYASSYRRQHGLPCWSGESTHSSDFSHGTVPCSCSSPPPICGLHAYIELGEPG